MSRAYTLQVGIPGTLLRTDTEFAEKGDDELYTTNPIPVKTIQRIWIHRVWPSRIEEDGVFVISSLTTETSLMRTLGLSSRSTKLDIDSVLLSQGIILQEREFWLKIACDGTYVCVAALIDDILMQFE